MQLTTPLHDQRSTPSGRNTRRALLVGLATATAGAGLAAALTGRPAQAASAMQTDTMNTASDTTTLRAGVNGATWLVENRAASGDRRNAIHGHLGESAAGNVAVPTAVAGTNDLREGIGVLGLSMQDTGVRGDSFSGTGVSAHSRSGTALDALSEFGTALEVRGRNVFSQAGTVTVPEGRSSIVVRNVRVEPTAVILALVQGSDVVPYMRSAQRINDASFRLRLSGPARAGGTRIGYFVLN